MFIYENQMQPATAARALLASTSAAMLWVGLVLARL